MDVGAATWSAGGSSTGGWEERQQWLGRVRGAEDVNGGSELLIFVRRITAIWRTLLLVWVGLPVVVPSTQSRFHGRRLQREHGWELRIW